MEKLRNFFAVSETNPIKYLRSQNEIFVHKETNDSHIKNVFFAAHISKTDENIFFTIHTSSRRSLFEFLSFFAFGAMCTYGFDCYLKFLAWRNNEVATGGGPIDIYGVYIGAITSTTDRTAAIETE
uniref:Uncharacterized protein n=1 Tax=Parascaris equorum TaxID=6256 RepID=A0A914RGC6_PAREQ